MQADLVNKKFGHNKFWNAKLTNKTLVVHYGKIGTEGVKQIKRFKSPGEAMVYMDKKLKEKLAKGYTAKKKLSPQKKYHYKVEYKVYSSNNREEHTSYVFFFDNQPTMNQIDNKILSLVPWNVWMNKGKNDSIIIKKELIK